VKSRWLGVVGAAACVATAFDVNALAILLGAGVVSAAAHRGSNAKGTTPVLLWAPPLAGTAASAAVPVGLGLLFLTFVKLGAVVFGSGYVLVAFLRADLVERLHWLTEAQLLDAVAVGQVTPGPVFTTATFIGYVLGGGWGAFLATVGIFLPGFLLVAAIRPIVARVRRSPLAATFFDGVNVGSLALMAVVTAQLCRAALVDAVTGVLATASAVLLLRFKVNPTWLLIGGAVLGVAMHGR
jgi:chromate transporter